MAVQVNGRPTGSSKKGAYTPPPMNGALTKRSRPTTSTRNTPGWLGATASLIGRLVTWYTIITLLFRCPSTIQDLTDQSPQICRPYFAVSSHVAPLIQPYYDSYAAPYVNLARPHIDKFDKQYLAPVVASGKRSYDIYGKPQVDQARSLTEQTWEKAVLPRINFAKGEAQQRYNSAIAPHIRKVGEATAPYYELARQNFLQTYHSHLLPAYTTTLPYLEKGYSQSHNFAVQTGIPYSVWAWEVSKDWVLRTVWPKVRIVWGHNVEPQLARIGERLGRYRDGKKVRAAAEEAGRSASAVSEESSAAASVSSDLADTPVSSATEESIEPSDVSEAPSPEVATEESTKADLRMYQGKFAAAADKGVEELDERIQEIASRQTKKQLNGLGEALIVELEETVKKGLNQLRSTIISTVKDLPEDPSEDQFKAAIDHVQTETRKVGSKIKSKAQALRSWHQTYHQETQSLVEAALQSTLAIIDNIRDVALQDLGMKWAWMEGVTYKDWAKYHELKQTFDVWRDEVVAAGTKHEALAKALEAGDDLEGRGMTIAEDAAKELKRLKEVGQWKVEAQDSSDDFRSTTRFAVAARDARQKILDRARSAGKSISSVVSGSRQGTVESVVSSASANAADVAASVSSAGQKPQSSAESAMSGAPKLAEDATSAISKAVVGTSSPEGQESAESSKATTEALEAAAETETPTYETVLTVGGNEIPEIIYDDHEAQEELEDLASELHASAYHSKKSAPQSVVSAASKKADNAASIASEAIFGTPSPVADSASSVVSDGSSKVSSAASKASNKVWGGANAGFVEARSIVYDDEDSSFSEKMQSIIGEAGGSVYNGASSAAGDAYGSASSVVVSIFTPPAALDDVYNSVSEQLNAVVEAASAQIYGTSKGKVEQASSAAASAYCDAQSRVSAAVYGTSTGAFENAQSQISDAAASAQSLISVAFYGEEKGTAEKFTSGAGDAYGSAASVVGDTYASASSVAGENYASVSSVVGDTYSAAKAKVSEAIYGPEVGAMESAQSRISSAVESARARINELYEGASQGAGDSVKAAVSSVESVASKVSEAAYNKKDEL